MRVEFGASRFVILTDNYAFKFPRLDRRNEYGWLQNVMRSLCANIVEWVLWDRTRADTLGPIVFHIPCGLLNVMPRAIRATEADLNLIDFENLTVGAERKADSWGWLNGRLVAIDYD